MCFLEYVSNSQSLQMAAVSSAPTPASRQRKNPLSKSANLKRELENRVCNNVLEHNWQRILQKGFHHMVAVHSSLIMDKYGRHPLLMIAAGGMRIRCFIIRSFYIQGHFDGSSLLLLARKLSLIGLLDYIATFSMGMGGILWVMMSEIFPLNMKHIAASLVSLAAWFGS